MCKQNLVKFYPLVLKILSGNENYDGMTERQNDGMTEGQTGQIQYRPTFSKRGYNYRKYEEIIFNYSKDMSISTGIDYAF